jgi:hypothetical protein
MNVKKRAPDLLFYWKRPVEYYHKFCTQVLQANLYLESDLRTRILSCDIKEIKAFI